MPGYDVTVENQDTSGMVCPHCELVLRDAVQTPEGDRLCETCYKEICQCVGWRGSSAVVVMCDHPPRSDLHPPRMPGRECSDCAIAIPDTEQVFPDRAVRREVMSLAVKCGHRAGGCPWQGMLKELEVSARERRTTLPVS